MTGRMPTCTARDVDRALRRGGFTAMHQRGSHRYYASPRTGKIVTVVPMHPGDIKRPLLKKIIQDTGLTEDQFRDLL
jgi:predicted RNA binding protein YcfA (HicA-like mRNA interferase family)